MSVILSVAAVAVGATEYPEPGISTVTFATCPFSTVQVALAPEPPVTGVNTMTGGVVYPCPPLITRTLATWSAVGFPNVFGTPSTTSNSAPAPPRPPTTAYATASCPPPNTTDFCVVSTRAPALPQLLPSAENCELVLPLAIVTNLPAP